MFSTLNKIFLTTRLYVLAVPLFIVYLGAASNQLVLAVNHDTFPVMENPLKANIEIFEALQAGAVLMPGYLDDTHVLMTSKTHLNFLADWIDLHDEIASPGDVLQDLGDGMWNYAPTVWVTLVASALWSSYKRYDEEENRRTQNVHSD